MIAAILIAILDGNATPAIPTDLAEINHCYDASGCYRFDQLIIWRWSPDYRRYDVVYWTIPDSLDVASGRTITATGGKQYRPTAKRETWSVGDPESDNRRLFPIGLR